MISTFDSADKAIEKLINAQCQELDSTQADDPKFMPLVESISKLRASLNPQIIKTEK